MNKKRGWTAAAILLVCLVVAGGSLFAYVKLSEKNPVAFVEKDGLLVVQNDHYEAAFYADRGGLAYLKDLQSQQNVSSGSRDQHLWWAILQDNTAFNSRSASGFSYEWDERAGTLTFHYDGPLKVDIVSVFTEANRFTMQAMVHNASEKTVKSFRFPYELNLASDQIRDALLPMLPGVKLNEKFFREQNSFEDQYPGVMFAAFVAARTNHGSLALYDLRESTVAPVDLGFKNQVDQTNTTGIVHNYKTWIVPQADWTSPRVAVEIGGTYEQSIARYRSDNGIDQYRPLADKLGDDREKAFASPFFKLDVSAIQRENWNTLQSKWLDRMRHTGVIHLVAFQQGGHDENYPDFVPPDPKWGTFDDFKRFIAHAREKGHLVVPYTNFSWWGIHSPTWDRLPEGVSLETIAVRQENGQIIKEDYGTHSGYVVNPGDPFVRERIAEEHRDLLEAGFDGIFEDQWGIRNTPYVFNSSIPEGTDPSNAYIEAMRRYFDSVNHRMYIEDGFDVLADNATGFMGSNLLWDLLGYRPRTAGYTSYYPMMGMLARDKVMQYQHDLAAETMTASKDMLRWNLAMGYHLSVDLANGTENPWIDVAGVFQKHVLSRYADQLVTGFEETAPGKTVTRIGDMDIAANWDVDSAWELDDRFTLSPGGVQAVSKDGTVRAGIYAKYNGYALDAEEHYLVELRDVDAITVYQPMGSDTTLAVQKGGGWKHARAFAYADDGTMIAELPVKEEGDFVLFDYISDILGKRTAYIRVEPSDSPSEVGEVPFKKKKPMQNFALAKPVESTTDTTKDYPASKAVDGDAYTYWESANRLFPQSITVDLEEKRQFNLLRLKLPPLEAWETRQQEIEVLVSDDGQQFRTVLAADSYTFDPQAANVADIALPLTEARYVRLTFTNNTGWPAAQVSELEVYWQE